MSAREEMLDPPFLPAALLDTLTAFENSQPASTSDVARRALRLAKFAARLASLVSGTWQRGMLSWLVVYVAHCLLLIPVDLPAGPWLTWQLIVGFHPAALVHSTIAVLALTLILIAIARSAARYAAQRWPGGPAATNSPAGNARFWLPQLGPLIALTIVVLWGGGAWTVGGDRATLCNSNELVSTPLGDDWWQLRCRTPSGIACEVSRFDSAREPDNESSKRSLKLRYGDSLIVASSFVRGAIFPTPGCASDLVLEMAGTSDSKATVPVSITLAPEPLALTVKPVSTELDIVPKISPAGIDFLQKQSLTLDPQTVKCIDGWIGRLTGASRELNVKLSGAVDTAPSRSMGVTLNMDTQLEERLKAQWDRLVADIKGSRELSAQAALAASQCELGPGAQNWGSRFADHFRSNPDCLTALQELAKKASTATNAPKVATH